MPPNLINHLLVEILAKEVRHVYVPQYESLTLKKIMEFVQDGNMNVMDYFPDKQEIDKVAREWICNVIATLLKNKFTDWLKSRVDKRNKDVVDKGEMNINMDADIFAAFQASTAVSSK